MLATAALEGHVEPAYQPCDEHQLFLPQGDLTVTLKCYAPAWLFFLKTSDMALSILDFSYKSYYAAMKGISNDALSQQ